MADTLISLSTTPLEEEWLEKPDAEKDADDNYFPQFYAVVPVAMPCQAMYPCKLLNNYTLLLRTI